MTDKRQEIIQILFQNDKNISWLKRKLQCKYPSVDLHYLLSGKSVNFDVNVYEEIMRVFRSEGFIVSENERCEHFAEQLIQVNGIISHSTFLLNSNASDFLKDNILDFREKKKLLDIVEKMKNEFNCEIDKIERLLEG